MLDGFIVFLRGESSVTESEAGGYIFSDEEKMTKLKIRSYLKIRPGHRMNFLASIGKNLIIIF